MDELEWLQDWYLSQCDDEWEHGFGPEIGTIDNPGWFLKMDLMAFKTPPAPIDHQFQNPEDENDWHRAFIRDGFFRAYGGPKNLGDLIRLFRTAATGMAH